MPSSHSETHRAERIGWLRAAVLGANDGIVSTASLVVGVAASNSGRSGVLIAGMAGLVAGALSMAAGEYVSVSSQSDTEKADLARERRELEQDPAGELAELQNIYVERGLTESLAREVAEQLTRKDALRAHLRDELGLSELHTANPFQAAWSSAASFSVGAIVPLAAAALAPPVSLIIVVSVTTLACLAALGGIAARTGGASAFRGMVRVTFWGAVALAVTAFVGRAFGAVVS